MLVIKLLLTPVLIGMVSLAGRRWGPAISGWFVGLPLTSGPVMLFLALDQGTTFTARAAEGTLLGLISVASFCLIYSWLSLRVGWLGSLLVSWCVFFASTFILEQFSMPVIIAFALVMPSIERTTYDISDLCHYFRQLYAPLLGRGSCRSIAAWGGLRHVYICRFLSDHR